jgi:hypothetical protein
MHSRLSATLAFSAAAAAIALAGCSGSSTSSQLPGASSSTQSIARAPLGSRQAIGGLVLDPNRKQTAKFPRYVNSYTSSTEYVLYCGFYESACYVLNTSGSLVSTITSGLDNPQGTSIGALTGNWYIASTDNYTIPEYSISESGGPTLLTTYNSATDDYPVWTSVFEKGKKKISSTLAISNIFNSKTDKDPSVTVLDEKNGKSKQLTYLGASEGIGIAYDAAGNCYWSFNPGSIAKYTKCKGFGSKVVSGLSFAGGLAFDNGDNLWYADQEKGIYKCSGTSSCTLQYSGFGDAFAIAFDSSFQNLYVSDASDDVIDICPLSGTTCSTFYDTGSATGEPPFGVAVTPAIVP